MSTSNKAIAILLTGIAVISIVATPGLAAETTDQSVITSETVLNTNGGSGGPGPSEIKTFDPSTETDTVHVWKRAAYPLRSDNTDAATQIEPPSVSGKVSFGEKPLTYTRGSQRNPVGIFDTGTKIEFDFDAGRANQQDPLDGYQNIQVVRAQIKGSGDSTGLPGSFTEAANLLTESNDNADFKIIENAPSSLQETDNDGDASELDFSDTPSEAGHYAYFVVINDGTDVTVDGNNNLQTNGEITVLGVSGLSVQAGSPSMSPPSSVNKGSDASFTVDSTSLESETDDITHVVALYDQETFTSNSQTIEVNENKLGTGFNLEDHATLEHQFSEIRGSANIPSGISIAGVELSEKSVDKGVSPASMIDFLATDLSSTGPSVVSDGDETLYASVEATTQDDPGTINVPTSGDFGEFPTGTYKYVYIAKDETDDTRMATKAGTISISQPDSGGDDDDDTSSGGVGGGGGIPSYDTDDDTTDETTEDTEDSGGSTVTIDTEPDTEVTTEITQPESDEGDEGTDTDGEQETGADDEGVEVEISDTESVKKIKFGSRDVSGTISVKEYNNPSENTIKQISDQLNTALDQTGDEDEQTTDTDETTETDENTETDEQTSDDHRQTGRVVNVASVADISPSDERTRQSSATVTMSVRRDKLDDPQNALIAHERQDGWERLETTVEETSEEEVILEAETDSFSLFAIVEAEQPAQETDDATNQTETDDATNQTKTTTDTQPTTDTDPTTSTDTQPTTDAQTDTSSDDGAGFGVGIAMVALLGASLLAARRQR